MPYTYEYDADYNPAMPMVELLVGRALAAADLALAAIVDSGADATIIPMTYLRQIRARKGGQAWMRGTVGERVQVDLFQISLTLGDYRQGRIEVVGGADQDEVILGRDVLNHLEVTLNGPAHTVVVT